MSDFSFIGYRDIAGELQRNGIVVVPLFSPEETAYLSEMFESQLRQNPFVRPDKREDYAKRPAAHWFGAMGDTWTLHMPIQRLVNGRYAHFIEKYLPKFGGKHYYFINRDRAMVRAVGTPIAGETTHRDQPPAHVMEKRPGDIVMGGWCSIDGPNRFNCVPGTHLVREEGQHGFTKLTPQQSAFYEQQMQTFEVPPGHAIIFFQNIVHEIRETVVTQRTTRIFQGATFTDVPEPWYPDQEEILRIFGVQYLPSGQTPWTFERSNTMNKPSKFDPNVSEPEMLHRYTDLFIEEFGRTPSGFLSKRSPPFRDGEWLSYGKTGKLISHKIKGVPGLDASQLPPEYTAEEKAIFFPKKFE